MTLLLNGWQRIGVVLSILWIIGAFYSASNEHERQREALEDVLKSQPQTSVPAPQSYIPPPPNGYVLDSPPTQPQQDLSTMSDEDLARLAGITLPKNVFIEGAHDSVAVPITWLVVYCIVWIFRWIRAGFAINKKTSSD